MALAQTEANLLRLWHVNPVHGDKVKPPAFLLHKSTGGRWTAGRIRVGHLGLGNMR